MTRPVPMIEIPHHTHLLRVRRPNRKLRPPPPPHPPPLPPPPFLHPPIPPPPETTPRHSPHRHRMRPQLFVQPQMRPPMEQLHILLRQQMPIRSRRNRSGRRLARPRAARPPRP